MSPAKAAREGRRAARRGAAITENPYIKVEHRLASAWRDGYEDERKSKATPKGETSSCGS